MAINIVFSITMGFSRHCTVDPSLLPSGNPFKYHVVVALSFQPMHVTVYYYYHV